MPRRVRSRFTIAAMERARRKTPTKTETAAPATPPPAVYEGLRSAGGPERRWDRTQACVRQNPMLVGFIAVGLIARIVFWAVTDRKLDDAIDHDQVRQEPGGRLRAGPQPRRRARAGIHLGPLGARPDARAS